MRTVWHVDLRRRGSFCGLSSTSCGSWGPRECNHHSPWLHSPHAAEPCRLSRISVPACSPTEPRLCTAHDVVDRSSSGGTAMRAVKSFVRSVIRATGYDVRRLASVDSGQHNLGRDPYLDMRKLASSQRRLTIFDVGANVGQTIELMCETFSGSTI